MPVEGYSQVQRDTVSGRALEAHALTRVAMALNDAMMSQDNDQLYTAVNNNCRLWLFFYSEIESGRVQLPEDVASNIVSLAAFVAKMAPRAFAGDQSALQAMVNINRNIAAGLSAELEGATTAAAAAPVPQGLGIQA